MKLRVCVVPECSSSSANQPHLAYHKFPSCPDTKRIWLNRMKLNASDLRHHTPQICSKHFRKDDYLPYHKTSKRMLKKGALPSTFPWGSCDPMPSASELHQESSKSRHKQKAMPMDSETTDAVESSRAEDSAVTTVSDSGGLDDSFEDVIGAKEAHFSKSSDMFKDSEKSMIESEENSDHGSVTDTSSPSYTPEKNNGKHQADGKYLPGVRLEAKDVSSNKWYKAKVVEVDWEDDELLIHFEQWSQRFDEWIPMDSSRLRPAQDNSPNSQSAFRVGETVMASWSDNKKYAARIKSILSGDKYEVLFFDGFCKVVQEHKISKGTEETLAMDPGLFHNAGATTMTKAERRERKRKIGSVAELFQIKKKNAGDVSKKHSSSEESHPARVALTFDEGRGGKSRQRAFPVIKGFADEARAKAPAVAEKKTKHKVASAGVSIYDHPTAGSSKEATPATAPSKTSRPSKSKRARRRKRDDNIDPGDYGNWEPEGEDAWLVECALGYRRSIKVQDDRLPAGWEKHSIQRASGNSAGKWDVFLVSPKGRRFRSRKEMVAYFADCGDEYKPELYDFTLRCGMRIRSTDSEVIEYKKKSSRKDAKSPTVLLPAEGDAPPPDDTAAPAAPLPPSRRVKTLLPKSQDERGRAASPPPPHPTCQGSSAVPADGKAPVGNVKLQMDNDALICPKEGCSKHFRKENLLQMHIKHYHPEYSKFMGSTPNVADLAYARTVGEPLDETLPRARPFNASFFEQINRFEAQKKRRRGADPAPMTPAPPVAPAPTVVAPVETEEEVTPAESKAEKAVKILPPDFEALSPKPSIEVPPVEETFDVDKQIDFEDYIKPVAITMSLPPPPPPAAAPATPRTPPVPPPTATPTAGIKTLLPVVRGSVRMTPPSVLLDGDVGPEGESAPTADSSPVESGSAPAGEPPSSGVEKTATPPPLPPHRSKVAKKRRLSDMYIETLKKRRLGKLTKCNDDSALTTLGSSPVLPNFPNQQQKYRYLKKKKISSLSPQTVTTPSSIPETLMDTSEPDGSPVSVAPPLTEEETFEQLQKRDIINCTCGIMEEDGLMIQCDLCLCWQHVLCNNSMEEVPDKYVCFICLNPARERKSSHYLHDQYWLKDGALPSLSFRTKDADVIAGREAKLKTSHDLTADLIGYKDVLHSLRVKLAIVQQPDHPKLYLWSEKPASAAPNPCPEVKLEEEERPVVKVEPTAALAKSPADEIPPPGEGVARMLGAGDEGASAVQDHTYVHVDEGGKRAPTGCAERDKPADEGLKLDSQILAQALTSGFAAGEESALMAADVGTGLDAATQSQLLQFPICRSELMRFANSMADNLKDAAIEPPPLPTEPLPLPPSEPLPPQAPQPEKPIDPLECRINLLDHIEDFQDQLESRLALIEDQVSALEAEDPEPPSEETISFYPQTKHTLQMLNRDLATMKKLATVATGYSVGKC